jgi:hypothetical protein
LFADVKSFPVFKSLGAQPVLEVRHSCTATHDHRRAIHLLLLRQTDSISIRSFALRTGSAFAFLIGGKKVIRRRRHMRPLEEYSAFALSGLIGAALQAPAL